MPPCLHATKTASRFGQGTFRAYKNAHMNVDYLPWNYVIRSILSHQSPMPNPPRPSSSQPIFISQFNVDHAFFFPQPAAVQLFVADLISAAAKIALISVFHCISLNLSTRRSYVMRPLSSASTSVVCVHIAPLHAYISTWSLSSLIRRWAR